MGWRENKKTNSSLFLSIELYSSPVIAPSTEWGYKQVVTRTKLFQIPTANNPKAINPTDINATSSIIRLYDFPRFSAFSRVFPHFSVECFLIGNVISAFPTYRIFLSLYELSRIYVRRINGCRTVCSRIFGLVRTYVCTYALCHGLITWQTCGQRLRIWNRRSRVRIHARVHAKCLELINILQSSCLWHRPCLCACIWGK
jgi:hypothetical protein